MARKFKPGDYATDKPLSKDSFVCLVKIVDYDARLKQYKVKSSSCLTDIDAYFSARNLSHYAEEDVTCTTCMKLWEYVEANIQEQYKGTQNGLHRHIRVQPCRV